MRFENPLVLRWILLVIFFVIVHVLINSKARSDFAKKLGERAFRFLASSVSSRKRKWKLFLRFMFLSLCFVALARPQVGVSQQEVRSEGVELMLMVDVSESMMAEDIKPNRLEQVKSELSKLIELMPGNKVGLVAFAGSAVMLSPLTTDPAAMRMYLDSLTPLSVSTQGTEFKEALLASEQAFQRGGVQKDDQVQVTRVVLIASDGEDHEPGALEQAEKMAKEGMRIFSLAYGTEKGSQIPERDNLGFLRGYKKDRQGNTVVSSVNGKALQELAKSGKGSFYHAVFGGDHIQKIADDISQLEKTQFETQVATQYDERYQYVLLLALIFGLLELFMGDRVSERRMWTGRFEVPPG